MTEFKIEITRFVDRHQPGFVEARFRDAWGKEHIIIEKVPVLTKENLWEDSHYPKEASLRCEIVRIWKDTDNRTIISVDTEKPWAVCTIEDLTEFDLLEEQVIKDYTH